MTSTPRLNSSKDWSAATPITWTRCKFSATTTPSADRITEGLKVDERLAQLEPQNPLVFYNLACSYSLAEEFDRATAALETALQLGYRDFGWLAKDPDLKKLRAQPAFDEVKAKIRQLKSKSR